VTSLIISAGLSLAVETPVVCLACLLQSGSTTLGAARRGKARAEGITACGRARGEAARGGLEGAW